MESKQYQNITKVHNTLSILVSTSYTSPTIFSMCSQLLSSSISKILTVGAKWFKMSIFHPLVKTVIET